MLSRRNLHIGAQRTMEFCYIMSRRQKAERNGYLMPAVAGAVPPSPAFRTGASPYAARW